MVRPLIIVGIMAAAGVGCAPAPPNPQPASKNAPAAAPKAPEGDTPGRQVTLFYLRRNTAKLAPVLVQVPTLTDGEEGILALVKYYLTHDPPASMDAPFPEGLVPRAVYLPRAGTCVLDIAMPDPEHPAMGSREEWQLIQAIVKTIALNIHDVRSVKILLNGKEPVRYLRHMDPALYYRPDPGA